ncbi:hypothetical protein DPX16_2378 [Anabarilius grahami]|uniref:Uncharacterized protein n=1 Tax=Anabarilius grahami TaxID=495550 RepID=A0A3N0XUM9_ANAGA|nr:hypothetical protein DPX16_2378 [Anabarilius grahami]
MDDLVDSISADTSGLRCGHVQLRIVFITPVPRLNNSTVPEMKVDVKLLGPGGLILAFIEHYEIRPVDPKVPRRLFDGAAMILRWRPEEPGIEEDDGSGEANWPSPLKGFCG